MAHLENIIPRLRGLGRVWWRCHVKLRAWSMMRSCGEGSCVACMADVSKLYVMGCSMCRSQTWCTSSRWIGSCTFGRGSGRGAVTTYVRIDGFRCLVLRGLREGRRGFHPVEKREQRAYFLHACVRERERTL